MPRRPRRDSLASLQSNSFLFEDGEGEALDDSTFEAMSSVNMQHPQQILHTHTSMPQAPLLSSMNVRLGARGAVTNHGHLPQEQPHVPTALGEYPYINQEHDHENTFGLSPMFGSVSPPPQQQQPPHLYLDQSVNAASSTHSSAFSRYTKTPSPSHVTSPPPPPPPSQTMPGAPPHPAAMTNTSGMYYGPLPPVSNNMATNNNKIIKNNVPRPLSEKQQQQPRGVYPQPAASHGHVVYPPPNASIAPVHNSNRQLASPHSNDYLAFPTPTMPPQDSGYPNTIPGKNSPQQQQQQQQPNTKKSKQKGSAGNGGANTSTAKGTTKTNTPLTNSAMYATSLAPSTLPVPAMENPLKSDNSNKTLKAAPATGKTKESRNSNLSTPGAGVSSTPAKTKTATNKVVPSAGTAKIGIPSTSSMAGNAKANKKGGPTVPTNQNSINSSRVSLIGTSQTASTNQPGSATTSHSTTSSSSTSSSTSTNPSKINNNDNISNNRSYPTGTVKDRRSSSSSSSSSSSTSSNNSDYNNNEGSNRYSSLGGSASQDGTGSQSNGGGGGGSARSSYAAWLKEEDSALYALVIAEQNAPQFRNDDDILNKSKFWTHIAERVPGRTAKQCRERWRNSVDPNITQSKWTVREDLLLLKLHQQMGNKWSTIASHLQGRTENGVKTRYKSIMRALKRQWTSQEDALLLQLYGQHGPRWAVIQKSLSRRTLHGVKMRYRALISGNTKRTNELGAPEQALGYDVRNMTLEELQRGTITGPESMQTKKRFLIESMLNNQEPDGDQVREPLHKAKRKRLGGGPCIIPGFIAIPTSMRLQRTPVGPALARAGVAMEYARRERERRRSTVVEHANRRLAHDQEVLRSSSSANVNNIEMINGDPSAKIPNGSHRHNLPEDDLSIKLESRYGNRRNSHQSDGTHRVLDSHDVAGDDDGFDDSFAHTISDMLLNAKTHPDVDPAQFDGFQADLEHLLVDSSDLPASSYLHHE